MVLYVKYWILFICSYFLDSKCSQRLETYSLKRNLIFTSPSDPKKRSLKKKEYSVFQDETFTWNKSDFCFIRSYKIPKAIPSFSRANTKISSRKVREWKYLGVFFPLTLICCLPEVQTLLGPFCWVMSLEDAKFWDSLNEISCPKESPKSPSKCSPSPGPSAVLLSQNFLL